LNKVRANQIASLALKARNTHLGIKPTSPICPYHLADNMGLDVRFVTIPSFEGMYLADDRVILISSQRPEGRKRFTCAHELGHHMLKHGTVIDEIISEGSNAEIEKEADFFASMLLMPPSLVKSVSKRLGLNFKQPDPKLIYAISKYIGVSFDALVTQMHFNLGLLSNTAFRYLKTIKPADVKSSLHRDYENCRDIFIVGSWWQEKAIDAVVGDTILSDEFCEIEGNSTAIDSSGTIVTCIKPGVSKICTAEWSCFVRVSRSSYAGMYQFMHMEEEE